MPLVASKLTRVELNISRTITTGSTRVHSILVTNASEQAKIVTFTDNDAVTKISIAVAGEQSFLYSQPWIADNGLLVSSTDPVATVSVTVMHGADGA